MTIPITLPDWLPWWVPLVLLVPALLYMLAFLFMPFSVIGLKSRLEVIEARLDELQGEIRHVALRMPEPVRGHDYDEVYAPVQQESPARSHPVITRPPIPPAAHELESRPTRVVRNAADRDPPRPPSGGSRSEPRLDWPR